ncbi:MAG TPA: DUF4157 domain-containing protein [Pyrinomonadaceae bacterium]|nr:DUF4157 domain-containing protein [Pyrinomonadaceae bacterium]
MADAAVEKQSTPEAAREAAPPAQAAPEQSVRAASEDGGVYASFKEIAASSAGQEPPPEKFFPIFRRAEFSHPVNDGQRARVLGALQEQYGNRYVQRVLAPGADVKLADTAPPMQIFRHEDEGGGGHTSFTAASVTPQIEQSHGNVLGDDTKQFMESRFGHDFDGVRVHDDSHAHEAANALSAEAFTTGRDIYFSQGAYQPATPSGQGLLAHELAHVVQQDSGAAARSAQGFHVSEPGDELEQQADAASRAVMQGEVFPPLTSSTVPVISRQASRNSGGGGGAPQGGGTTTGGQVGGGAPARAGDFPINVAGTTIVLPTAALIDKALPGGRLPVPSSYLKYLSLPGFKATGAGLDFDESKAIKGASIDLEVKMEMLQGTGTLTVDKNGNASGTAHLTFSSKRTPGIKETTVDASISKEDFKVDATLEYDLPHVTGTLSYKYENKQHSGKGTAKYEGSKLKGDIEIVLSEAGKISGSGKLEMELFKGLRGEVDVAVDEKRDIQVKGKVSLPGEIELFPEKKMEKSFFSFEKKFPLWGITIPVIDVNVGLFAEIHAGAGFRAKFGPGVLRDIALTGEFGTDPEAATEFGLGGEFFVPAGAEIVINAGGGIGLGLAIADITGGIEAVGVAGVYTALSVRPQFQYAGGKYSIGGVAELMGVAQAKFSINAFAKIDVGVWLFKGTVWRKDWTLAEWAWNAPLPINLRATINYTLGEDFAPEINFETPEVDPEKLIKDVMPESGSPVPAPPKPAVPDKGGFNAGDAQGKQAEAGEKGPTPQTAGSPQAKTQAGQTDPGKDKTDPTKQGKGATGKPGDQPDPKKKDGEEPSDPAAKSAQVKSKVAQDLSEKLGGDVDSVDELDSILSAVFQKYKPDGLKSLTVNPNKGTPGEYDVMAEASLSAKVAHFLRKIVGLRAFRLKLDMFSEKTFLFVDMPDGSVTTEENMGGDKNIGGIHAEEFFLGKLPGYVRQFRKDDPEKPLRFVLRLNRAPCPSCITKLSAEKAKPSNKGVEIVVMPTAPYARSKGEGELPIIITTVKHLADLVEAGIPVEVWDIWAIIKQEQSDPILQKISDDLINQNLEGKAQLENQLRNVKAELENRRKMREANKR